MSALVNGSSGQICAGCRVWWSARTAGMREEAGDATPGGVQRLISTPAKAGAGSTSGMPGWLTNGLRDYVVGHPGDAHGELAVDGTGCPRFHEGRFSRQVTRRSECSGSTAARRYGWNR